MGAATAAVVVAAAGTLALVAARGLPSMGAWPLRAETPTPAPAVAATSLERPSPEPALALILGDPSVGADRTSAFVNLYGLWQLNVPPGPGDPGCEFGRKAGLRCLSRTGTWTVLRRLNLPAVLELVTPDGAKHHVVISQLDGDRATLQIGERRVILPTVEIERFWDGPFTMVWKAPVTGPLPLQPGTRGRDVLWLRQQLTAIDGASSSASGSQLYDDELKRRVVTFQQSESLTPDGIAGEETVIRLAAVAQRGSGPSLVGARP